MIALHHRAPFFGQRHDRAVRAGEAHPARRHAAAEEPRQPLARMLAQVAEGGRGREAGALEALIGIAVNQGDGGLESEATVDARDA